MKNHFDIKKELIVSSGSVFRTTDDIIIFDITPGLTSQTLEEIKETFVAYQTLLNGEKLPILVDISEVSRINPEVKNFVRNNISIFSSVAYITNKSVSKVILNLFLQFYRQNTPIKLFPTIEEAKEWSLENHPLKNSQA